MSTFDRLASFGDDSPGRWHLRPVAYSPRARGIGRRDGGSPGPLVEEADESDASVAPTIVPRAAPRGTAAPGESREAPEPAPAPVASAPVPPPAPAPAEPSRGPEPEVRADPQVRAVPPSPPAPQEAQRDAVVGAPAGPHHEELRSATRERALPRSTSAEAQGTGEVVRPRPQAPAARRPAPPPAPAPAARPPAGLVGPRERAASDEQRVGRVGLEDAVREALARRHLAAPADAVTFEPPEMPAAAQPSEVHVHIDRVTVIPPTPAPPAAARARTAQQPSALSMFLQERGRASR
ncbi:hypothetical protein [Propioniciclava sinopodophylli]|uniref:hypothetical protein n=1 Tax=Propioniciclava sinopodophylli TaxID=1837344 RepID=UPI0024926F45|nr:hypothetical protein [Propioniciclava sinopodophylli]